MDNPYAKVVNILANPALDFRALAFEVAKVNPKAFVEACERLSGDFRWKHECRMLRDEGKRVAAVKLYREHTRLGLKEALTAVEAL